MGDVLEKCFWHNFCSRFSVRFGGGGFSIVFGGFGEGGSVSQALGRSVRRSVGQALGRSVGRSGARSVGRSPLPLPTPQKKCGVILHLVCGIFV